MSIKKSSNNLMVFSPVVSSLSDKNCGKECTKIYFQQVNTNNRLFNAMFCFAEITNNSIVSELRLMEVSLRNAKLVLEFDSLVLDAYYKKFYDHYVVHSDNGAYYKVVVDFLRQWAEFSKSTSERRRQSCGVEIEKFRVSVRPVITNLNIILEIVKSIRKRRLEFAERLSIFKEISSVSRDLKTNMYNRIYYTPRLLNDLQQELDGYKMDKIPGVEQCYHNIMVNSHKLNADVVVVKTKRCILDGFGLPPNKPTRSTKQLPYKMFSLFSRVEDDFNGDLYKIGKALIVCKSLF
jgi:hypothetical protein